MSDVAFAMMGFTLMIIVVFVWMPSWNESSEKAAAEAAIKADAHEKHLDELKTLRDNNPVNSTDYRLAQELIDIQKRLGP